MVLKCPIKVENIPESSRLFQKAPEYFRILQNISEGSRIFVKAPEYFKRFKKNRK
jgi:hypothetical protein